jgi:hypothetical protein
MLLSKLGDIYKALDSLKEGEEQARYKVNTEKEFENLTPADFE